MDELDETVLNLQQRQKRAQIMHRNAPKIERARKMAQKRLAPEKNIKQRAYAMARQLVRKRVAGSRGAEYEKLGPTEKMIIDRAVEKKQKAIKKLALRLIPKVKSSEQKRLHTFMQGQRIQNHGAPEGHKAAPGAAVSEALNDKFQRTFQSVDGVTNIANKTSNPNIVQYNTFGNEKLSDTNLYKSIAKKAKKSGIKEEILGEIYDRGLAAWYEETGVSQQQYAFARVNSYINQGKTYFNEDSDLHEAGSKYNIPMARAPKANKAPVKTFMSVLDQVDIPAKHLDRARSVWNRTKDVDSVKKFVSSVKEETEVEESNNTPYVKPHMEKGSTKQTAWKASNKHGRVKYFGMDFKKSAEKHAGINEEEVQQTNENFIDGKGPGKPGDSSRHGLKGKSATELRKIRSSETASPRKKQLAHWMLNMHHNEEVEIDEVYQNDIVKSNKLSSRTLGKKLASGHKKLGTLPNGHEVHMKSDDRKHYYRVVDPHTKEVNSVLTTKPHKGGAEEIDTLVANEKSSGAHHLYQHLVLKHNKVLSSNNQSAGARKVWAKAASHRSINTHGYDPDSKSAFHAHPSEDEHYSSDDDYDNVQSDMDKSKRDKRKYKRELDDIQSNDSKYIVMHKKLKEETELSELSTKIITAYRRGMEKDVALKPRMDPKKRAQRERGFRTSTHKILGLAKVNATESLKDPEDNPCWKGYKPVGTKKKAGKTVPNCVPEEAESIVPQTTSKGSRIRKKIEVVDRKPPHTEFTRQSEIQKKIIDEEGNCQNDPKKRLQGTDSLVKAYKKDTPGQGINEAFNIAYAAGVGVTLTAGDLGMKMQSGFALHPSVVVEEEEVEEEVVTADKAPVVVPAHKDAYGNTIPAKTVMRKKNKVIVKSGNTHDGDN